jgi:hypothetical protein
VVVYPVAPIAERVEKGSTMWVHWCFHEEKKIRGVWVKHIGDVDQ